MLTRRHFVTSLGDDVNIFGDSIAIRGDYFLLNTLVWLQMPRQRAEKIETQPSQETGIGDRIRQVRGDFSQAEFAAKYSMHKNTLFRIEKGESEPSYKFLQQLVTSEGVSPEWLLIGSGDMFLGTEESVGRMVEDIAQKHGVSLTYTEYHALTELAKSSLLKKIDALIEAVSQG